MTLIVEPPVEDGDTPQFGMKPIDQYEVALAVEKAALARYEALAVQIQQMTFGAPGNVELVEETIAALEAVAAARQAASVARQSRGTGFMYGMVSKP
jgi:hypothetical protein